MSRRPAKPRGKLARAEAAPTAEYGLIWFAMLHFDDDHWHGDRGNTRLLARAVAATAWWKRLDALGVGHRPGGARGTVTQLEQRLADADRDVFTLARGDVVWTSKAELWFRIDLKDGYLTLGAGVRDGELQRMGAAAIDDFVGLLLGLRDAWRGACHIDEAWARPIATPDFEYPRQGPPRRANLPLDAVVELFEAIEPACVEDWRAADAAKLVASAVPLGAERSEHDGVIVQRWVGDPRDRGEVAQAAGRHEAWMAGVIETQLDGE